MAQNDFLHSPRAEQLLKNREKVLGMMNSPDAQRLMALLQQTGGSRLEDAAQAAMQGDPTLLTQLMQRVMATPEGARTVDSIQKDLQA